MAVITDKVSFSTRGHTHIVDITEHVQACIRQAKLSRGVLTAFVSGSTGALTTIEYESGVVDDLKDVLERIAPHDITYKHDARWGDGNGYAHVRAALVGPSLSIPFADGALLLGTWQQVVFLDFDNRPRHREVVIQMVGTCES